MELKCRPLGRGCCVAGTGVSELKGQVHWDLDPASEEKMQRRCVCESGKNSKFIQPSEEWRLCDEETKTEGAGRSRKPSGRYQQPQGLPLVSPIDRHWQGAAGKAETGLVAFNLCHKAEGGLGAETTA